MHRLRNTFEALWAALMFFTRLPLWRIHQPPQQAFRRVVEWWPLAGWLTGGTMALVLCMAARVLPWGVAVLVAMAVRMLLTGALHEDGLADCCDGFGGGTSRERTLLIMKDSHIGTYGVLGLLLYVGLLHGVLTALSPCMAAAAVAVADPLGRTTAALVTAHLPYARDEQTAKSGVVYRPLSPWAHAGLLVQGLLPFALGLWLALPWPVGLCLLLGPVLVGGLSYAYLRSRLGGYTGDCCGGVCLLAELSFLLLFAALA